MLSRLLVIVIGLAFLLPIAPALGRSATPTYEVWVLDQGTNQLLIYDGALAVGRGYRGTPEMLDLSPLGGTRPHMIAFTSDGSRAIIANVGNGFVYIFSAHDRRPIFVEDTGLQAHAAIPTPDGSQIVVANQNDKNLTEIVANGSGGYSIGRVLDLDPLQDPDLYPDVAPICPVPTPDGRSAYITLRGGGLFILDLQAWTIVAKFTRSQVAANGCGGVPSRDGGKMYINSGSATSGSLYVFDLATHTMMNSMDLTPYGTDAHGAALTRMGRFLWVVNRLADNAVVVDTSTDTVVGTVEGIGDAPDLMVVSPFGERAFITLRGPNPATGTHAIAGMTPGVAVVNLEAGGRNGRLAAIIPIGSWSADSPNDPHGIALRIG